MMPQAKEAKIKGRENPIAPRLGRYGRQHTVNPTHTPSELKRSLSENAREPKHTPSILGICRLQK